jgi:hypothetical protein
MAAAGALNDAFSADRTACAAFPHTSIDSG